MQQQAYADIHHFDSKNTASIDDDGDPRLGWYFQLMQAAGAPLTELFGPYASNEECEDAAVSEWMCLGVA